jgi:hypothetical protein
MLPEYLCSLCVLYRQIAEDVLNAHGRLEKTPQEGWPVTFKVFEAIKGGDVQKVKELMAGLTTPSANAV